MTNETQNRERYDLIPGITAYRLARIYNLVVIGLSVLSAIVAGVIILGMGPAESDETIAAFLPVFAVFGVTILIIIGFTVAVGRRSKAETAAGYTTRTSGFAQLDQVDPRTGVVIRRAGSAVFTPPRPPGATTPSGASLNVSSRDATRFPDARPGSRGRAILIIVLAVAVPLVVLFGFLLIVAGNNPDAQGMLLLSAGITVVAVALIVLCVFWVTAAASARRLRRVQSARPDAFVFQSQRTPELQAAITAGNAIDRRARLPLTFVVTVGSDGLGLWNARRDTPEITVRWSEVDHVQPAKLLVSNGRRSFPANTIHVFVEGSPAVDLPLPVYGTHGLGWADPVRANAVLDAFRPFIRVG